ncbi:MAG TPA: dienelactone hydrolase family protein [Sphingobium sp.]|uniref:dienelactone hydrolase family protein n=1 Tax=Sphingobium sp. TaxID=1912891 RepID=UPI002ED5D307
MRTEHVTYEADGCKMESRFFIDDSIAGKRPGVLVFPEAFGLGDHALDRARRLAELGYAALACDLHGEGAEHSDIATVMELLGPLQADSDRSRARARGGLDALTARPEVDTARIAAIGYCFGGTMALELARSGAEIAGVVGFHCGLGTSRPDDAGCIKGKILVCIGADDPSVGADQRAAFEAEMGEAKVDWQLHVYGGVVHSFTSPAADQRGAPAFARYDIAADRRSWAAMQTLFEELFGLPAGA